jgi:hypothetical protein
MNELTTPRALCIVLRSSVAKHIINAITIRCVYSARVSQCHFHFLYIHKHKHTPCRWRIRCEGGAPATAFVLRNTACRILFCTLCFLHCVVGRSADFRRLANCSPPQRVRQCKKCRRSVSHRLPSIFCRAAFLRLRETPLGLNQHCCGPLTWRHCVGCRGV